MNSGSERSLSLEELKRRNQPTAPAAPETHPTEEEWENLQTVISAIYRLMEASFNRLEERMPNAVILEMEKDLDVLKQQTGTIKDMLEQAGKKKERRFSLPHISLPNLGPEEWFFLLMPLAALALILSALFGDWSTLSQLLP